ncbi:hypothetical protein FRC12_015719 [Ceratobasidium sp. 428]|nr:hypothetical protein FRC12_015719 [Ceratobasidium sp. 428]
MPAERAVHSQRLHRPSPLPKSHYTIPKRLPSPFGVNELFDWSSSRPLAHANSSQSTSRSPVPDVISISSSGTRPLFTPSSSPPYTAPAIGREGSIVLQSLPTPATSPTRSTRKLPPTALPQVIKPPLENPVLLAHHEKRRLESPSPVPLRKINSAEQNGTDSGRKAKLIKEGEGVKVDKGKAKMEEQGDENGTKKGIREDQDPGENEDDQSVYESMVGGSGYGGGYGESERDCEESSETEEEIEEPKVQDEGESEQEADESSEEETEAASSGKQHAPVYLDLAAKVESFKTKGPSAHEPKPNQSQKKTESTEEETGWTGPLQGTLAIRKSGNSGESVAPGKWSFSGDGAARQPVKDRAVGDIHFSPSFSGSECDYWVLHGSPKPRWVSCKEGHSHPLVAGYVLGARKGTKAPRWIKAQSLRANKCRGRKSI